MVLRSIVILGLLQIAACSPGVADEYTSQSLPVDDSNNIEDKAAVEKILPSHLVIIGDSIMAWSINSEKFNISEYQYTTSALLAAQGLRTTNLSLSGQSIYGATELDDISGGINFVSSPDAAIWIQLGVNDMLWGFSNMEDFYKHYVELIRKIKIKSEYMRIYCAVPLLASSRFENKQSFEQANLGDYRDIVRRISREGACNVVETDRWFDYAEVEPGYYFPDGLHMGRYAHLRYSSLLLEAIKIERVEAI